ncbi:hypothetical protein, partial [Ruminococcus bicirculans (ex Wegman et al. 2014)]|uniref:hypothetical protein n=1 Tax=Ruminococcus bicirculans (ex Wegman et al. 2014) TaxID=1160721 RepID=UPI00241F4ECA
MDVLELLGVWENLGVFNTRNVVNACNAPKRGERRARSPLIANEVLTKHISGERTSSTSEKQH